MDTENKCVFCGLKIGSSGFWDVNQAIYYCHPVCMNLILKRANDLGWKVKPVDLNEVYK